MSHCSGFYTHLSSQKKQIQQVEGRKGKCPVFITFLALDGYEEDVGGAGGARLLRLLERMKKEKGTKEEGRMEREKVKVMALIISSLFMTKLTQISC